MRIQGEVESEVSSCFHYGENSYRGRRENVELSSTKRHKSITTGGDRYFRNIPHPLDPDRGRVRGLSRYGKHFRICYGLFGCSTVRLFGLKYLIL